MSDNPPFKTITRLTMQKRDKERVNIFLDGEYAFSLSLNAALGLKKGQKLTPAELDELRSDDEVNRAYRHATRYISYRPRSVTETERNLREKDYDEEAIMLAIERLKKNHHLDDTEFARFWIENRERFKPRSARALRYELRQKGIDNGVIDEALAEIDEELSAWAALEPRVDRWRNLDEQEFRKKAMGFLGRRGFGYGVARGACDQAIAMIEEDET